MQRVRPRSASRDGSRAVRYELTPRQSVGVSNATQAILLATYRALALLPRSHLPPRFVIPPLPDQSSPSTTGHHSHPSPKSPDTPYTSRAPSPGLMVPLQPISTPIFAAAWLGLAGVNTAMDIEAFSPYISKALAIPVDKLKVSNGRPIAPSRPRAPFAEARCEPARGSRARVARCTSRRCGGLRNRDGRSDSANKRAASQRAEAAASRGRCRLSRMGLPVSCATFIRCPS